MKNLVIVGHPDKNSFCYNGIFKTIISELQKSEKQQIEIIDLYHEDESIPRKDLIKKYQDLVTWSDRLYFVSPVWWFRLTPKTENFFDEVFTPEFAFKFINITKIYANLLEETVRKQPEKWLWSHKRWKR